MPRSASSRTVSTSTDSSVSARTPTAGSGDGPAGDQGGAGPVAHSGLIGPFAAAGAAVAARVSRFFASPSWQHTKNAVDWVMITAAVGALGWMLCSSVFLGTRAVANRQVAVVHLGGQPEVQITRLSGEAAGYPVLPSKVLTGDQTARVSFSIANDGPDGIVIQPGTLTGPYLSGAVQLLPDNRTGYILGNGTIHFLGTVTVNCDAAAAVARTLVVGGRVPQQQPTTIAFELRDTNKVMHKAYLVIDTTAAAVQGRVCTR